MAAEESWVTHVKKTNVQTSFYLCNAGTGRYLLWLMIEIISLAFQKMGAMCSGSARLGAQSLPYLFNVSVNSSPCLKNLATDMSLSSGAKKMLYISIQLTRRNLLLTHKKWLSDLCKYSKITHSASDLSGQPPGRCQNAREKERGKEGEGFQRQIKSKEWTAPNRFPTLYSKDISSLFHSGSTCNNALSALYPSLWRCLAFY